MPFALQPFSKRRLTRKTRKKPSPACQLPMLQWCRCQRPPPRQARRRRSRRRRQIPQIRMNQALLRALPQRAAPLRAPAPLSRRQSQRPRRQIPQIRMNQVLLPGPPHLQLHASAHPRAGRPRWHPWHPVGDQQR
eukprot:s51_g2.t2